MMLIVQIRLTSHWLGELKPDHRGVRKFKRDRQNRMLVNADFWRDQFCRVARELGLHVDIRQAVLPPNGIVLPSLHLHRRIYSQGKSDMFESFRTGTVLTFDMRLDETRKHCPTLDQLSQILQTTGEWFGLSPWGSEKYNYGRFMLLNITKAGQTPQSSSAFPVCVPEPPPPEDSNGDAPGGEVSLTRESA